MGSAKYFHPSALAEVAVLDSTGLAEQLDRSGAAHVRATLRWEAAGARLEREKDLG